MAEQKTTKHEPIVVGIGELLWDVFPDQKSLGGAPANFAFHASQLGAASYVVSTVGDDELGQKATGLLKQKGIHLDFLKTTARHPTGTVAVEMDDRGNHSFRINEKVAWDYLPWSDSLRELAVRTDVVCFGSLAQRAPTTRRTLRRFLDAASSASLRVFDINLRLPYPERSVLLNSLERANVLKLNDDELSYLSPLLSLKGSTAQKLSELIARFDLCLVALTQGEKGSMLADAEQLVRCPGFSVDVQDSVGAGDAFTAALTMGYLRRFPLARVNTLACQTAAHVCSRPGAMATLPAELIREFASAADPAAENEAGRAGRENSSSGGPPPESGDVMRR